MRTSRGVVAVVFAAVVVVVISSCGEGTSMDFTANESARDALGNAGVDPSSELMYEHFFYFDDEVGVRGAEDDLLAAGFEVETLPPDDDVPTWSLKATQRASLDAEQLDALTIEMQTVAERHGGTYDGWGSPIG